MVLSLVLPLSALYILFFFFNDTATTEIYTLSLHDALPISPARNRPARSATRPRRPDARSRWWSRPCSGATRSEEHTSELQSLRHLVCRLLLEKKKKNNQTAVRAHLIIAKHYLFCLPS